MVEFLGAIAEVFRQPTQLCFANDTMILEPAMYTQRSVMMS